MPYFQRSGWPPFAYRGAIYDLSHLDEYTLTIRDSAAVDRVIAVTFSDHCFTTKPEREDDSELLYAGSSRRPGHFSFDRYGLTFDLPDHIDRATRGIVWTVHDGNFAATPTVNHAGSRVLYAIIFSLAPVTGLPVDLHMRVETAHPVAEKPLVTFGSVRFPHLVALRMGRKQPKRITDQGRKVPRVD